MRDYVIIVAGGKGLRMGSDIPKQFLPVGGRPVLMRTIERFREYSADLQIILVLPKAQQDYWRQLCQEYNFPLPQQEGDRGGAYQLADGGETRFHSVQHGLALIPDDARGIVGVHDGVRPFPSVEVIARCYETARTHKAVVPVIPVVETLRHVTEGTKPRSDYRLVQTPQTFDIQLLKAANRAANGFAVGSPQNTPAALAATYTDDASVVEAFGFDITLVDGNRENIKITTPYDLKIAETLI